MANSAITALTEGTTADNPVSYYDYYNAYGQYKYGDSWRESDPNRWVDRIANFFTGDEATARQQYDLYLNGLQNARDDSSISRAMNDMIKAGYNPWLSVQNGVPSLANNSGLSSMASKEDKAKDKSSVLSSALKIMLLLLLKAPN